MPLDPNDPRVQAAVRYATTELWRRGDLDYKFHATQQRILDAINASDRRQFFLLCSRRLGKTFMLLTLAFAQAIRCPGSRILFLAPVGKNAAEIATDTARMVLQDCPPDLLPSYNAQLREFEFKKTGSLVRLKGVNSEHADDLRGGATDLVIVDECAQMDGLEALLKGILLPMTMVTPANPKGGRILLATTPPTSPGHDSAMIYERLAASNDAVRFTLLDAPHIPIETKREFLVEMGETPEHADAVLTAGALPKTTTAQREYWCMFVTDASKAVLPEFPAKKDVIVKNRPRPPFFDSYVSIDPGMNDKTGILYAYYDFAAGKIVVEDESLLTQASTVKIASELLEKEYGLWPDQKPYLRVSDVDKRLAVDLWEQHGIKVTAADKPDSDGAINLMRTFIQSEILSIDPRCTNLIRQIENCTWNNKGSDLARAGDNSPDGHYDLIAALKYLCRAVNRRKNPYPEGYRIKAPGENQWLSPRRRFWNKGRDLGLLADTPVGRKLAKRRNK